MSLIHREASIVPTKTDVSFFNGTTVVMSCTAMTGVV